jgi:hypothetical protein
VFLTSENYYSSEANKYYMSVSQFKSFLDCELAALAEVNGIYKKSTTDALLVGSYVDAWCEGTLEKFQTDHEKELFNSKNKQEKVLLAKFQHANDIINIIQSDINVMAKMIGDKQTIFTADLFGVPWKIKIDIYNPDQGFFSDLKIMANLYDKFYNRSLGVYENFIEHYKYNLQMCVYAMVEKIATKRKKYLEPYIVAITKENPPNKGIFNGFLDEIQSMTWFIEEHIPRIINLKNGKEQPIACGKCEYCRSIKTAEIMDYHYLLELT